MDGPLLTLKDLATLMRIHPITVSRLKSAGRLPPHVVVGARPRWRAAEVHEWIRQGCPISGTVGKLGLVK